MASISFVLDQIKRDPLKLISPNIIHQACDAIGYTWRNRALDPATTIGLFIQQVVHGNVPCTEVCHLSGQDFSASAYCQARSRIPLQVYQGLLERVYQLVGGEDRRRGGKWIGHRIFLIDGSGFSMSDTASLQKEFGQPPGQKPGCGFPVAHALFLFNARTGLLADVIPACCNRGDLADVRDMLDQLAENDVLLGDDSYGSFAVLAMLLLRKMHGLFPVHHARIVDFTPGRPHAVEGESNPGQLPLSRFIKSLGHHDQVVEYFKPKTRPRWMSEEDFAELPKSIRVRELCRSVTLGDGSKKELIMATTLLDAAKYPAGDVADLRRQRWEVETNIGHMKTTMKMDVLRCKSPEGIKKELCIFALVYNLVRVVMLEAARKQKVAPNRISFADVLHWLKHVRPGDTMPAFVVNPLRPGRHEPRVKKRRPKPYTYMSKPREELRKTRENCKRRA